MLGANAIIDDAAFHKPHTMANWVASPARHSLSHHHYDSGSTLTVLFHYYFICIIMGAN